MNTCTSQSRTSYCTFKPSQIFESPCRENFLNERKVASSWSHLRRNKFLASLYWWHVSFLARQRLLPLSLKCLLQTWVVFCRFLIHTANPQSWSVVINIFACVVCTSVCAFVPTFQNIAQQSSSKNSDRYWRECGSGWVDKWWHTYLVYFVLQCQNWKVFCIRIANIFFSEYFVFVLQYFFKSILPKSAFPVA